MAGVSKVANHPQNSKIIAALASGTPYRDIAAWADPPVSTAALCRFARGTQQRTRNAIEQARTALANNDAQNQQPVIDSVTKAAMLVATDPFLLRVHELRAERAEVKREARADGDLRTYAALDRNDLSELELHAKLAGRLNDQPGGTTINIVCPMQAPAAQVDDVVTVDISPAK